MPFRSEATYIFFENTFSAKSSLSDAHIYERKVVVVDTTEADRFAKGDGQDGMDCHATLDGVMNL